MPKHLVLNTGLEEQSVVKAWTSLGPDHAPPESLERLGHRRKSTVFRLPGVGRGASAVVGKRCRRESARIERAIYGEILPRLSISALHYYGSVDEPDADFSWIFIEDAGGKEHAPQWDQHGPLIVRWLALLHAGAAALPAAARLPARGPGHYFEYLQSGRAMILQNLGNPLLRAEDLRVLEAILSQYESVEARRSEIEGLCDRMPRTLVHGDFVPKNMRVRSRDEGSALLLYDWETAGWGVPAADLAELPRNPQSSTYLAQYSSNVSASWPQVGHREIEGLAAWGRVFRLLAMISWESLQLPHSRVHSAMGSMRYYQNEMAQALKFPG